MKQSLKEFTVQTKRRHEFITITKHIQDVIKESGIKTGMVIIQTHHTTCGVWINEDEKNLIGQHGMKEVADLHRVLDRFAHPNEEYGHNDVKDVRNPHGKRNTHLCDADSCGVVHECINGHAHAQALMIKPSLSMIVKDGQLLKGRWQEVMLIELDHDRKRTYSVLVQGK